MAPPGPEQAKTWAADWVLKRVALNVLVTDLYVGFWCLPLLPLLLLPLPLPLLLLLLLQLLLPRLRSFVDQVTLRPQTI